MNKTTLNLNRIPKTGFLATESIGDFAQLNRQKKEIENLEMQSGFAPFLSTYLFDISAAPLPDETVEITEWMFLYLNEDQKTAVRKAASAPAIFLLQGPPGTGKTIVATEISFQHLIRGEKVLISSQSNLAVDNVLDKFLSNSAVRAIRLGKDDKVEENLQFSKKNALGTYYKAIARACRERFLDPWKKAEERIAKRKKWIQDSEIIYADIKRFKDDLSTLKNHRAELDRNYKEEDSRISENRLRRREREGIEFFKEMLEKRNAVHSAKQYS